MPEGLEMDWPLPPGVRAFVSTRSGGVSEGPYASLNLGAHVGDLPEAVAENRRRLAAHLGASPRWLRQVHGAGVLDAQGLAAGVDPTADAVWSAGTAQVCAVLVADCMPVLFTVDDGSAVAAAHAGWRGLALGVLERTVETLCEARGCRPGSVLAWLGPCIGPRRFEVGDDVREAFGSGGAVHFQPHRRADGSHAWLCDLVGLARDRLEASGLRQISGGRWCTHEDASRFFSFRRDRVTGRLAAAIVRDR